MTEGQNCKFLNEMNVVSQNSSRKYAFVSKCLFYLLLAMYLIPTLFEEPILGIILSKLAIYQSSVLKFTKIIFI